MDKLTMAHDYAVAMLETPAQLTGMSDKDIAIAAFNLADAMQAEADKRNPLYGVKRNAADGLEEIYPEYAHGIDYPSDAWVMYKGEKRLAVSIKDEWQPDWSQAPALTTGWSVHSNGSAKWHISHGSMTILAPLFDYKGKWKNSLRKRPQGI